MLKFNDYMDKYVTEQEVSDEWITKSSKEELMRYLKIHDVRPKTRKKILMAISKAHTSSSENPDDDKQKKEINEPVKNLTPGKQFKTKDGLIYTVTKIMDNGMKIGIKTNKGEEIFVDPSRFRNSLTPV